jgi:methylthioribose-1-phosphate isomerase
MNHQFHEKLTIFWESEGIVLVDQTKLPDEYKLVRITTIFQLVEAIRKLKVRGAPALAAAGAYGIALAARKMKDHSVIRLKARLRLAAKSILETRPTAVNLFYGVDRVLKMTESCVTVGEVREVALKEALRIADEDVITNKSLGAVGASLLNDGDVVMTYCNAGRLATVGWGTALGIVRTAIQEGKRIAVYACETRPLNQGSRITAFELLEDQIPTTLITDNAAASVMKQGKIDCVIVGADRITKTAVYNKVGTYMLAICAKAHGVPFYVAAPLSTFDYESSDVKIEQRDADELIFCRGKLIAPRSVQVENPAFDATPREFVTGIITEDGVVSAKNLEA